MEEKCHNVTYTSVGDEWGDVAHSLVDRQAHREGNALQDSLASLVLASEDGIDLGLDKFITEAADIGDLGTDNNL